MDLLKTDSRSFFIEVPIASQLNSLFNKEGFYDSLSYRFNREIKEGVMSDIYDGNVYRKYFDNDGILASQNNISFQWNTDGVPVFKSSKFSMWPLYLSINELPLSRRFQEENMVLVVLGPVVQTTISFKPGLVENHGKKFEASA